MVKKAIHGFFDSAFRKTRFADRERFQWHTIENGGTSLYRSSTKPIKAIHGFFDSAQSMTT
ncbi:hypothetical protein BH24PSE2_BH24PSE2_21350 [soil metagenome]